MKEYLLLFRNISGNAQYISTPQDMAEDMPQWQAWIGNIAMQGKLISTQPIFWEGKIVSNQGIRQEPHISKTENEIVAGYIICKAESTEEVEAWAKACPILKYEQANVEIREMMPFII